MNGLSAFFGLRKWRARFALFALGLIAIFGFAPFHIWGVTLLSLSLFFAYLIANRASDVSGFWMSLWYALGYFIGNTYWIGSAFIERGPEFIPLMPPMVLGLALLMSSFWALAGHVFQRFGGQNWTVIISLTGLFTLAELVRGHIFGGLPWNLPGYMFEAGGPVSQMASLINIYGLTAIVFAMAASLAWLFTNTLKRGPILVSGLVLVSMAGFGLVRLSSAHITYHDDISLRIVQVPFEQNERLDPVKNNEIISEFIRQSVAPGLADTTHLIWPEGAVPGLALENDGLIRAVSRAFVQGDPTPPVWLLNTLRHELARTETGDTQDIYYNSSVAMTFTPDGVPAVQAYNDKHRLVPFGEVIPGGGILEELGAKTISLSLASITPAKQKVLASFPRLPPVSAQICYEIIFPGLMSDLGGAEWILNQSNDAWYGGSTGPHHHANIAAYRAIETGLPVVRSASNGISGVIDPYGRYITHMSLDDKGVLDTGLPRAKKTGQKTRLLTYLIALLSLIGVVFSALSRKS